MPFLIISSYILHLKEENFLFSNKSFEDFLQKLDLFQNYFKKKDELVMLIF